MTAGLPTVGAVASLVRLPAVLSVPGDALTGAALAGGPVRARAVALTGASACLYLGGMALNDWADREQDARERPGRPIPAGEVSPNFALGLSARLTVAGVGLAALVGGRPALRAALPLAACVWNYDLVAKATAAGPVAMAACRSLDVLLGAAATARPGAVRAAAGGAAVVGAHTFAVTRLSRHEVSGAGPGAAREALRGTAAVTAAAMVAAWPQIRRRERPLGRAVLLGTLLAGYGATLAAAQRRAVRDPSPATVQRAVGAGVLGLMPLEAGLLAASGPVPASLAVGAVWPVARTLARRRAVT